MSSPNEGQGVEIDHAANCQTIETECQNKTKIILITRDSAGARYLIYLQSRQQRLLLQLV